VLKVENVSVTFAHGGKSTSVLSDFSFSFEPTIRYGILAPSGSGKTSLLRAIAGLELYSGRISLGDNVAWRRVGKTVLQPQRPPLLPWYTVRENLKWAASLGKAPSAGVADAAITTYNLGAHKDKLPRQLSGGWKHIAAYAMSTCVRPDLLLADEPFSGVDHFTRKALWDIVKRNESGVSYQIFVTHDPAEAVAVCDKILLCSGPPLRIVRTVNVDRPSDAALVEAAALGLEEMVLSLYSTP